MHGITHKIIPAFKTAAGLLLLAVALIVLVGSGLAQAATESGSVGLEGKISAPPPSQAPSISFPTNGSTIRDLPVTVTGICQDGLLVKLFKNNVFAGSGQCTNGSFSIQIDLFSGANELIARQYDDLDQSSPDSAVVTVTFPTVGFNQGSRVSLTSNFAKRGANPGDKLIWPIAIAGGSGPYAISVDWGDGKTADIISQAFAGVFNIEHVYDQPGIYNVVVRATDSQGNVAFLQLVAVANGPLSQTSAQSEGEGAGGATKQTTKILWQPAAISIPLILSTFYLGRKYELFTLRKRLEQRDDFR